MEDIVKYALNKGVDDAEIYLRETSVKSFTLETDRIKGDIKKTVDVVIRIAYRKRVASQYLTTRDKKYIREAVDRAIEIVKSIGEDPHWRGLPCKAKPYIKSLYFDGRIEDYTPEDMVRNLSEIREEAFKYDDRVKGVLSSIGSIVQHVEYYNSNGVEFIEDLSGMEFEVGVTARENDKYTSLFRFIRSRQYFNNYIELTYNVAREAINFLGSKRLEKPVNKVVFTPLAIASILFHSLFYGISGDYVLEGISPLKDKLGKEIASKDVNIYDDGTIPGGWRTSIYDDEGVPRRRTPVIVKGVLKSYLHNYYTASRMGLESTGNAERRGTTLTVRPSNLVIQEGDTELYDVLRDIDEGVYVDGYPLSAHTINISTGDASVVFQEVYYIKDGSIQYPLNPVALSGNVYEMLKNMKPLKGLASTPYGIYTPYIYTEEFTVKQS